MAFRVAAIAFFSCLSFWSAQSKIYDRCELAFELREVYGFPEKQLATWLCIANYESHFNTSAHNPGSGDHGIFQISELFWCSPPGVGLSCGVSCAALKDDDIEDDVICAKRIYRQHQRISGDGFTAWVVYNLYCRNKQHANSFLDGCFDYENAIKYGYQGAAMNLPTTMVPMPETKPSSSAKPPPVKPTPSKVPEVQKPVPVSPEIEPSQPPPSSSKPTPSKVPQVRKPVPANLETKPSQPPPSSPKPPPVKPTPSKAPQVRKPVHVSPGTKPPQSPPSSPQPPARPVKPTPSKAPPVSKPVSVNPEKPKASNAPTRVTSGKPLSTSRPASKKPMPTVKPPSTPVNQFLSSISPSVTTGVKSGQTFMTRPPQRDSSSRKMSTMQAFKTSVGVSVSSTSMPSAVTRVKPSPQPPTRVVSITPKPSNAFTRPQIKFVPQQQKSSTQAPLINRFGFSETSPRLTPKITTQPFRRVTHATTPRPTARRFTSSKRISTTHSSGVQRFSSTSKSPITTSRRTGSRPLTQFSSSSASTPAPQPLSNSVRGFNYNSKPRQTKYDSSFFKFRPDEKVYAVINDGGYSYAISSRGFKLVYTGQ